MTSRSIIRLLLPVLTLVACVSTVAPDGAANQSPRSPLPTSTPAPPDHTSPLPDPFTSPIEPPSGERDEVALAAKAHLARDLGVQVDAIAVASFERVDWPDASLGCPQAGQAYAQVITPGYRAVLQVNGKAHELHTDLSGRAIVICEQ